MSEEDVADLEAQFLGVGQVLLSIASGVDDDRSRARVVSQQIGGVGEAAQIVLFENHRNLSSLPFNAAAATPGIRTVRFRSVRWPKIVPLAERGICVIQPSVSHQEAGLSWITGQPKLGRGGQVDAKRPLLACVVAQARLRHQSAERRILAHLDCFRLPTIRPERSGASHKIIGLGNQTRHCLISWLSPSVRCAPCRC